MLRRIFSLIAASFLIAACDQSSDPTPVAEPSPPAAQAAPSPAQTAAPTLARKTAPMGALAYIIAPADGAIVQNPVRVVFGLKGAGVAPAGNPRDDAGHHHLLIDTELPNLDLPIPADDNHRHFGGGQTEAELTLAPGAHTLQLLLGDEIHVPHNPPIVSEVVTIEVRQ